MTRAMKANMLLVMEILAASRARKDLTLRVRTQPPVSRALTGSTLLKTVPLSAPCAPQENILPREPQVACPVLAENTQDHKACPVVRHVVRANIH